MRIMKLMVPTLFATSITQINLIVDTIIASFLQTGSISWLYFSDRLVEFPLGVFGIALATVILPSLSEKYASGAKESYAKTLNWGLRWVFLISLPAAVGLALLAQPILTTVFQYNEFTFHDVQMASRSLAAYSLGLPAFILIKILSSAFFARQDTKTPVKIGVVAMLSNIILNLLLVVPLAHAGLALATSLSACLNAGLLFYILNKNKTLTLESDWTRYLIKLILAVLLMSIVLIGFVPDASQWTEWQTSQRITHLFMWISLASVSYFLILQLSGVNIRQMTRQP